MRAIWKDGSIISLKLRDDVYSLAQMFKSPYLRFYDIFRATDVWQGVDLNAVVPLFCLATGRVVVQRLGVRRVPEAEVTPSDAPFERHFIEAGDNSDGYRLRDEFMWRGGRLLDLGDGKSGTNGARTVIPTLTVKEHRDVILKHEFTNVYGDTHVAERLLRFHDEGINEDPMKVMVFPELAA